MLCLLSISQANEVYRTYCPVTEITPVPRREIFTATWPNGCIGIDIDTGAVRQVCSFNAWHPSINRQGTLMCTDTTFPDIGLQLFDPRDGVGDPRPLCFPEASSEGRHWDTDHCPYDDEDYQQGKWTVYAPQHTHPHPAFSPDGKHVVFTSDRTGHAQVYVVTLPAVRALRRRPDLLVVLLPDILLYRELHPYEPLHAARIQWRNEIERDISSLFERDQNETLNEIYNETKLIRLLLTGKGAVPQMGKPYFWCGMRFRHHLTGLSCAGCRAGLCNESADQKARQRNPGISTVVSIRPNTAFPNSDPIGVRPAICRTNPS